MGVYIAQIIASAIETMGASNVVQVLMDNAKICRDACAQIKIFYPHIYAIGCDTHSFNLVLQNWYKGEDTSYFREPIEESCKVAKFMLKRQ